MNKDNMKYYNYLEALRRSGVTNMYGAGPYLAATFDLTIVEANKILSEWMRNYNEIIIEINKEA